MSRRYRRATAKQMKLALTVKTLSGDSTDVTARFADFVAFERTWNRSIAKLETEMRLTDLAWLAWHASKRTNPSIAQFDPDWLNMIEEVSVVEDGDSPLGENQHTG